jgi:hypothetical protein
VERLEANWMAYIAPSVTPTAERRAKDVAPMSSDSRWSRL